MPNNPTKILLSMTLIGGILVSISSNSWLGAWMGLEINLMSIIPLMSSQENIFTAEASLKYFIIQALASAALLFLVVMETLIDQNLTMGSNIHDYVIMTPLLLKMGAAPFHWWFPSVMEGLSWQNCLLMMTLQKAAPMMLVSYSMKMGPLILAAVLMSVTVGSMGGMNQTSLRKILTYSSINHTGWMLMALMGGGSLWMAYYAVYSLLTLAMTTTANLFNISFINQTMSMSSKAAPKIMLFTTLLSLGGLPPFIGFLPKWIVIQTMVANNLSAIMVMMVVMSLVTLYYYLRMCYSSFISLHDEVKWGPRVLKVNKTTARCIILSSMSMMGLIACTVVLNIN
uniref:NADH-ubiquinone oxidoreductase chain 2 n=1 Tax=Cryptotermes parvifrons TaxID=2740418 RepID=A0A8X8M2G7_9NEOP|nr:NADH dehydrogenase subunit 2 [Cryptotermes parvifrons]